MSVLRNIVTSSTEPSVYDLWVKNNNLHYFGPNGWTVIGTSGVETNLDGAVIINDTKRNKVGDQWALATGESTYAHGYASATFNENTVAYNDAESAFGRWNVSHDGLSDADQTLHSIGFGTGEIPANAFEIMSNGDTYLYGVGNYNGTNADGVDALSLQKVINALSGGGTPKTLDVFDASALYDAYTSEGDHKITDEFKAALIDAVQRNALVYIANDNKKGFSFKVVVVFAGKTDNNIDFTASDHVAHYMISVDLNTNVVTLQTTNIIKSYVFNVEDTPENNAENKKLATQILFNRLESVRVQGIMNGVEYNTLGIYSNGYITTIQEEYYTVFSVNFNTGKMEVISRANTAKLLPFAELKVGNDNETMQYNIENLPSGSFFVNIETGYGVGTFHAGEKGFAHVTSPYGNEVFYEISPEGAITRDADYVKPNEPYTLLLDQSKIGTMLDDVTASNLKRAGEIVVNSTAGPITYTRTTDSTQSVMYFTDSMKNGDTVLLTYTDSNKMLNFTPVSMAKATPSKVGGITQGAAIQDASISDAVTKFNQLLAELRTSGVIAQ